MSPELQSAIVRVATTLCCSFSFMMLLVHVYGRHHGKRSASYLAAWVYAYIFVSTLASLAK